MTKILRNMAQCKKCGEILESFSVHDFVTCGCGEISVDGGHEYLKRSAMNLNNLVEMSSFSQDDGTTKNGG